MLRLYSVISVFCFTLTITSCSTCRIKNEIESFCKDAIRLPAQLEMIQDGIVIPDSMNLPITTPIKLIIYFPTDRCTSCVIGKLGEYETIFRLKVKGLFSPIIIFSLKENAREYKILTSNLKFQSLPYPIYIDKHNEFQQLNKKLPEDSRYHAFLLDKNNHIVLVGNPLASDAMWSLFKSTLDNMLAHDGVYVPEK